MLKLIMTKGLPASGKSTWAKTFIAERTTDYGEKWKRINKDDLRAMLDNGAWSRENEEFILESRDMLITTAMLHKFNVIVDDTNLVPKHEQSLKDQVRLISGNDEKIGISEPVDVKFEVKDFTDVPLETCIYRDSQRANAVGKKVIMQMYNQYLKPVPPVVTYDPKLPTCIVCDLDGTLALFGKKNPYDRDFENDWVNEPVANIIRTYGLSGIKIIFVSGRTDKYKGETMDWLTKNKLDFAEPIMRKDGDVRKDVVVKTEIYAEHIKNKYNVMFVLDDRDQVVNFWRSLGLPCFQVAEGDF
jgi:predicted kinase